MDQDELDRLVARAEARLDDRVRRIEEEQAQAQAEAEQAQPGDGIHGRISYAPRVMNRAQRRKAERQKTIPGYL